MKRFSWALSAGVALSMLLSPLQMAQADEKGWGLVMQSPHVGIAYVYVTSEGIAFVYPKTGARVVTHAPDWRAIFYNDKTKVWCSEEAGDISKTLNGHSGRRIQNGSRITQGARKGKTDTIAGVTATQYFITTMSANGPRQAEAWITTELIPPPQFLQLMGRLFQFDPVNFPQGMPLRVRLSDEAGRKTTYYDTLQIKPQVIKSASFNYPSTYTKVDSELEVFVDAESRKKMQSIMEDSGGELDALLDKKTSKYTSNRYTSGGNSLPTLRQTRTGSYYDPTHPQVRPTSTTTNTSSGDWFGNMSKMLGGK